MEDETRPLPLFSIMFFLQAASKRWQLLLCYEVVSVAKLTEKQKRFVQEYLLDLNATQAAIRAGYSEKTAEQMGYQLLQKTSVQEAVQEAMKNRQQRTEITQDCVLSELGKVAFAKAADYTDSTLKYSNKLRALELLGKHLGMFDGKGAKSESRENNLLEALKEIEEIDTNGLDEVE